MNATIQKALHISQDTTPEFYDFGIVQVIKAREVKTQNRIEAKVRKAFLRKEETGYLYNVQVTNRTQTNTEGRLGIEAALSSLLQRIVLFTNDKGEIIEIVNHDRVLDNWQRQKRAFKTRFNPTLPNVDEFMVGVDLLIKDKQSFLELIQKNEVFTLLFLPIYKQQLVAKKVIQQQKDLFNFFEEQALTLKLNTLLKSLQEETGTTQVVRTGKLDKIRFDLAAVKKDLRAAYQTPNLSVEIKANYLEAIDLNEEDRVIESTQMLNVEVAHIYNLRQFTKLKKAKK